MPSKYNAKTRPAPTKQMPLLKELSLRVAQPRCACPVCGMVQTRPGKCECGATFQGKSSRF